MKKATRQETYSAITAAAGRRRQSVVGRQHFQKKRRYGGKSFIGLLAGLAVGAIVAFATGGIGIAALAAFAVTANVVNFFLGPKGGGISSVATSPQALTRPNNSSGREQAAAQLNLASSSESVAVPVIFGRNQMVGNYIRYDRSTFRSKPIIERTKIDAPVVQQNVTVQQSGGGGKGGFGDGGSQEDAQPSTGAKAEDRKVRYEERVIGFEYRIAFEMAFCHGPIDEVHDVRAHPGDQSVLDSQVDSTNSIVLTLDGEEQGGTVRLYKGNRAQVRQASENYTENSISLKFNNHRMVCFGVFGTTEPGYYIGHSPQAPSYTLDVTRMPDPRDDSEATIATIKTRGGAQFTVTSITSDGTNWTVTTSAPNTFKLGDEVSILSSDVAAYDGVALVETITSTTVFTILNSVNTTSATTATVHHLAYEEANPAAILWEVLTNKQWGRGESETRLNQASFEVASQYFEDRNIGMSFHLEAQDVVTDAIESIRLHVNTVLVWDGLEVRCVPLDNAATAYARMVTLNADDLNDVQFSRKTWKNTTNELRAQFTNRLNNYQSEIVTVHDVAARITAGQTNSERIALKAFSIRSICEPQAKRILHSMAFPKARLTARMNEFNRRLLPADFVKIIWKETEDAVTHTFWRVLSIDDTGQQEQGFRIELEEDTNVQAYTGAEQAFSPPVPFIDTEMGTTIGQVYLGDDFRERYPAGTLSPARVDNLPIFTTAGVDGAAFGLDRSNLGLVGVNLSWKLSTESAADWKKLGFFAPWIAGGAITTDIPFGASDLDRSVSFNFVLNNEANESAMLASANKVVVDADDFETLTSKNSDLFRIGDEIMLIGSIVDSGGSYTGYGYTAATVYTATNIVRGVFGSRRDKHYALQLGSTLKTCAYTATYSRPTHEVPRGSMPEWKEAQLTANNDTEIDFKASPVGAKGSYPAADDYEFTGGISGRGSDPEAPGLVSAVWASTPGTWGTWTLKLRPRWHNAGFGILSELDETLNALITDLEPGYKFWIRNVTDSFWGATTDFSSDKPIVVATDTTHVVKEGLLQSDAAEVSMTFVDDDGATSTAGVLEVAYQLPDADGIGLMIWATLNDKEDLNQMHVVGSTLIILPNMDKANPLVIPDAVEYTRPLTYTVGATFP